MSQAPQVDNAAMDYMPAQIAQQSRSSDALRRAGATPPQTYQFNVGEAQNMTDLLGKYAQANDLNALHDSNPAAYTGYERGVQTIAGGTPGDDQFLNNAALTTGLNATAPSGIQVNGAGSAGAANVANIFGKDLLNYRNQRAGQQVALGQALKPDVSLNPGQATSAFLGNDARAVDNANTYRNYLSGLTMTDIGNQNNNLWQNIGADQSWDNANAQNQAAATGQTMGLIGSGIQAIGSMAGSAMKMGA